MGTVREDWHAWLPEGKEELFDIAAEELEVAYVILSVALHDSLALCRDAKWVPAREGAILFMDLFDRLSARLQGVLRSLDEHGRILVLFPNVAALCVDYFRGEQAQQVARIHSLSSGVTFRARARFFRKLEALEEVIDRLQSEARSVAHEIGEGCAVSLANQWTKLEVLDYDLNTCLRETLIVLKSFLCALPSAEIAFFRKRLFSWLPITVSVHPRRLPAFSTRLATAGQMQSGARETLAAVSGRSDTIERPAQRARKNYKDNSRSKDRIPLTRMRPDRTSGPNET